MNNQLLHTEFEHWRDGIQITLEIGLQGGGIVSYKCNYKDTGPSIDIFDADKIAQHIMDEIWKTGVRPS